MPYLIGGSRSTRYSPMLDTEPFPTPGFLRLMEQRAHLKLGVPWDVPTDTFPTIGRATTNKKSFPDVVGGGGFFAFSSELRDIIEGLEPNVHQFSDKYSVFYKDGRPAEKTYYCINIKQEVRNSIIWEQSKIPDMPHISGFPDELVFDEAVVGKLHLWRALDASRHICISDKFYSEIQKAKIKDFHYQHELIGQR
jgi:hypothetical protein